MRKKVKEKIIEKVLNGDIENEQEKNVYLEYLNKQLIKMEKKYKENNRDNFKHLFHYWLINYKDFHWNYSMGGFTAFIPIFLVICFLILCVGLPIELSLLHIDFTKSYSLKIIIFTGLIPSVSSLIKAITKNYFSTKKIIKEKFLKEKNILIEEIEDVKKMQFEKENIKDDKDILNTTSNERYILNTKEKTKIYEKITSILIKIKEIDNVETRANLALKLIEIVNDFDTLRIKLENLNPEEEYLVLKNKVDVELSISLRLDELERKLYEVLNKEERMEKDSVKVKSILDELKPLSRG